MSEIFETITLDLKRLHAVERIKVKQYDANYKLIEVNLVKGAQVYTVPENFKVSIKVKKPDGHNCYMPCEVEGNIAIFGITPQMTVVPGICKCEIEVLGPKGEAKSGTFLMEVEKAVFSTQDEVESLSEYESWLKHLSKAQEYVLQVTQAAQEAKNSEKNAAISELNAADSAQAAVSAQQAAEQSAKSAASAAQKAEQSGAEAADSASKALAQADRAEEQADRAAGFGEGIVTALAKKLDKAGGKIEGDLELGGDLCVGSGLEVKKDVQILGDMEVAGNAKIHGFPAMPQRRIGLDLSKYFSGHIYPIRQYGGVLTHDPNQWYIIKNGSQVELFGAIRDHLYLYPGYFHMCQRALPEAFRPKAPEFCDSALVMNPGHHGPKFVAWVGIKEGFVDHSIPQIFDGPSGDWFLIRTSYETNSYLDEEEIQQMRNDGEFLVEV